MYVWNSLYLRNTLHLLHSGGSVLDPLPSLYLAFYSFLPRSFRIVGFAPQRIGVFAPGQFFLFVFNKLNIQSIFLLQFSFLLCVSFDTFLMNIHLVHIIMYPKCTHSQYLYTYLEKWSTYFDFFTLQKEKYYCTKHISSYTQVIFRYYAL